MAAAQATGMVWHMSGQRPRCGCGNPRCKLVAAPGSAYAANHHPDPAERSKRMAQVRKGRSVDFSAYRDNPAGLARDVFGIELWARQAELVEMVALHDRVACRSGHKTGKSMSVALLAWWWTLTRATGRVVMTAPTARQIRSVVWREVRRLHRTALATIDAEVNEVPERGAAFEDGREIIGFSSDEAERFAGISGEDLLFVVDEASGISADIYEAILGSAAGDAKILLVGNPTRSAGPFFDAFHSDGTPFKQLHISSLESPNVVNGKRLITGLATRKWVDERRADWGEESPLFAIRVKGDWPAQSTNAVCGIELVEAATRRWTAALFEQEQSRLVLGVDPARFGDDSSVIFAVRGFAALKPTVYRGLDSIQLAARVFDVARQHGRPEERVLVQVDSIGIGAGVVDQLRTYPGLEVRAINAGESARHENYARTRDELWFGIADWLKAGGCIPNDPKLTGELVAVEYGFLPTGKIKVESKDDLRARIGRSPDRADALALAVYTRAEPVASFGTMPFRPVPRTFGTQLGHDDDDDEADVVVALDLSGQPSPPANTPDYGDCTSLAEYAMELVTK